MSVDSVAAAAAIPFAARLDRTGAAPAEAASTAPPITDTVELSPTARRLVAIGTFDAPPAPALEGSGLSIAAQDVETGAELHARLKQYAAYRDAQEAFQERQQRLREELDAITERLRHEAGGLLEGVRFDADLSRPITRADGSPHPKAEELRTFLQAHRSDLDRRTEIWGQLSEHPTFDQWKERQGL